jgi:ketosteroid isomerase-like protein
MKITNAHSDYLSVVLLIVLLFSGCTNAPTDVKSEIEKVNESFIAAYNSGDAKTLATNYTENAKLYPSNSEAVEGPQAIEGFWNAVMKMGIKSAQLETTKAEKIGNIAIEEGRYKLFVEGDVVVDQGKYLVTWEKVDGQWKITKDIWNTNNPAPIARAAKDDGVWVIAYYIKGDKVEQFEDFNTKYLLPAGDEFFPALTRTVRLLKPKSQNPDGTFTFFYVMDPMIQGADYRMMPILEAKYGKEKAEEYHKALLDCVKKYESFQTVQTGW